MSTLAEFEAVNEDLMTRLSEMMPLAEEVLVHLPQYSVPDEAYAAYQESKRIEHSINNERDKILHHRGVGVDLDLKSVTKETVLAALHTIINDTRYCKLRIELNPKIILNKIICTVSVFIHSYYQRMQELSRVFRDRPMTPQE
jgi:hypothetical protein